MAQDFFVRDNPEAAGGRPSCHEKPTPNKCLEDRQAGSTYRQRGFASWGRGLSAVRRSALVPGLCGSVSTRTHVSPQPRRTEETVSKGVDLANRSTQTVLNAAQSQLGLDDLVATLTENLEASLLVIASQQDRIEHLEMRLERRVRDTRRSTDVDDQQVTAIDHAIQRRT